MHHFSINKLTSLERFYRANLINSLSGFKPAILVGTKGSNGINNLAIFQNVFHLGADPSLIGMVNRPLAATPHTLNNIKNNEIFTLNACSANIAAKAHQSSAKYGEEIDEFMAVGLSPVFKNQCIAPFVAESPVQCSLQLIEIIPVQYNGTYIIIGQVLDIYIQEELLHGDGFVDLEKADIICT